MSARPPCRLGVLAFGDSITNGAGESQWGVSLHSWALWVARALGLPYTGYAVNGALAEDVVDGQIPAFRQNAADPAARFELGCLYIGVNDVRGVDWEVGRFEQRFRSALDFLGERCDRTVTLTAPLDLGRPRAGAKVEDLNAAIERAAGEARALVADLRRFGARNRVMTDHVHPTALGQIEIAHRALQALEQDGAQVKAWPSSLIDVQSTRWSRLRADVTYAYRHAKVSAWAAVALARAG